MVNQDADSGPRFIPSAAYKDHAQLRFGCQVLNNHNNGDDDPPYCVGCQEIQFLQIDKLTQSFPGGEQSSSVFV